ncbi:MAG: monovalent cation:proton antiporter-2 (CPA2) family protein [Halieaceae bacterium]|jgi:monovalent cation:proton antiporter-2 (CPA2) family protein
MTETHYLTDILILLAAAILTVPVFQRLGAGSILGYLAAGALVGPWGFGFIDNSADIRTIAEFGVIFLLFSVGIELKPSRLWTMRRLVFGLGASQVFLTGLVITGLALLVELPTKVAVIIGFSLAFSSTAVGLQTLSERGEMGSHRGRAALSTLLMQDLAVVPLLTLIALFAAESTLMDGLEYAVMEAVLVLGLIILTGKYLLSPVLALVATSRTAEIFMAAAVFTVLGTAWLMEEVGLSMALGAFLAGLMLAESHYRHQIIADIQPFRGILLGLFFMGVGMSIDFVLLTREIYLLISLVAGLLTLKALILWLMCRVFGSSNSDSIKVAFLLAQSGEFALVAFGLASLNDLLPNELFRLLTLVVVMSMMMTPLMVKLGDAFTRRLRTEPMPHDVSSDHLGSDTRHVIIAGFGRVGRQVARVLQNGKIPYLAIELDPDKVLAGRKAGFSVFYGDASQPDVLKAAGAADANILVCTLDQLVPAERLVSLMRQRYPDIAIHVRGRDDDHCEKLRDAGATLVISETLESSLQLGSEVLREFGIVDHEANALTDAFRTDYYSLADKDSK